MGDGGVGGGEGGGDGGGDFDVDVVNQFGVTDEPSESVVGEGAGGANVGDELAGVVLGVADVDEFQFSHNKNNII